MICNNCAGQRDFSFTHTPSKNTFADEIMKSSFIGIKKYKYMILKIDPLMNANIARQNRIARV